MKELLRILENTAKVISQDYQKIARRAIREADEAYRDEGPNSQRYKTAIGQYGEIVNRWIDDLTIIGRIYTALTTGSTSALQEPPEEDTKKLYSLLEKLSDNEAEKQEDKTGVPA